VRVSIVSVKARLRAPFVTAWGSIDERELLLLSLEDSQGRRGFGEAAPLEPYDGVSVADVRDALEDCRATLAGAARPDRAELLAECATLTVLPQALAAIDLALWDLAGRAAGEPVWRLLGAGSPPRQGAAASSATVQVNYTISATDRAGAAAEAGAARQAGFRCVKVKVGVGDDAGRIAAVRAAAGREVAIRLDANGAWSPEEAAAALRSLEPAGIELCEEPVGGLEALERLGAMTHVALAIDESAGIAGALDRRLCTAACLKIGRGGGISGVLAAARRARVAGYEVYLASTLDGPLGIAAALHTATAIAPVRPCGLATLSMFAQRPDLMVPRGGTIEVPAGPGLGEGLVSWYGVL
jgi:L-Ala-D/L-Glu epimerase